MFTNRIYAHAGFVKVAPTKHLEFYCLCHLIIIGLLLRDIFRYNMMWEVDLEKLPMKELTTEGALLFVWVTNKQKLVRYVKETLFPLWSVQMLAQWYWLKVDIHLVLWSYRVFSLLNAILMRNCNHCYYRYLRWTDKQRSAEARCYIKQRK